MIFQITRGKLSLDDFGLPDGCWLRPVQHNEKRVSVEEDGITLFYIQNKATGARKLVLLRDVERVRTLILGLDQGSIGSAGVAAAAFQQCMMIWGKFDKIHRIIRDIRLAQGGCCCKIFEKTKLWSTYLFGLNSRPFGSGSNHTLKSYLMFQFRLRTRVTSANFQRYVHRIGGEFGMPSESMEDQEAILHEMYELKSFEQKLGQPKASNWFAWNGMAKEQMREFTATKCVFAEVYSEDPDPDDEGQ